MHDTELTGERQGDATFGTFVLLPRQSDFWTDITNWMLPFRGYDMRTHSYHVVEALVMDTEGAIGADVGCLEDTPNDTSTMIAELFCGDTKELAHGEVMT